MTNEVLEHVIDLGGCLQSLYDLLNPGGRLYAGWGPLWFSPTGGHQLTVKFGGLPLPWSHLIKPLGAAYVRATERRSDAPRTYWDFNYLRPRDYERLFAESPFEVISMARESRQPPGVPGAPGGCSSSAVTVHGERLRGAAASGRSTPSAALILEDRAQGSSYDPQIQVQVLVAQ